MIEKMYGEDVFQYSAVNDLFPAEYDKAVEASGIEPVDRPEVDIVSMNTEDGVVLKAVVTVKPEMKVGNYIGLKAEKGRQYCGGRRSGRRGEPPAQAQRPPGCPRRQSPGRRHYGYRLWGFVDGEA